MPRALIIIATIFMIFQHVGAQKKNAVHLELKDFLKNFYDMSTMPKYESNSYSAETSTYDRAGGNNDGFAGTYSFVRKNADSTLVIFDVKGTGVINRIWTPTPTHDSLDFYIDDTTKPAFTICYIDLYSGKIFPFVSPLCANQLGGYYCYLPIPFNESCKIVLRGKKTMFHQIGYRLYKNGTQVRKFSLPLNADEKQSIEMIRLVWEKKDLQIKDLYDKTVSLLPIKKNFFLKPGQTIVLFETSKPGRIAGFEITSSSSLNGAAKNIDIRITWDDEKTPAVYCPLADYFGYAFGKASMSGLLVGSDGMKHYSRFPMPFDKSAKIELIYRHSSYENEISGISFSCSTYFTDKKRDLANEGKFYAYWQRNNPVPKGEPHVMLNVNGKGHFAGVVLQAQGLKTGITDFFEGDDSTVVDGELRMHGTGSEDFFNGGWYALLDCWDAAMSLPMSGALDYSIPLCRTGGYRFFISDKISFGKNIFQSIEHGPEHNLVPSDYTSVSYYYCDRLNPQKIFPDPANTKIYMPDTLEIYPQLMPSSQEGYTALESKWAYPVPERTMFYTINDGSLVKFFLRDVPADQYAIYIDYVKSPDAAGFSLWQRQTQLTEWIDAYSENKEWVPMQKVGMISVTDLNNSFSFRFKTKTDKNKFTLNRIILIKNK